MFSYLCGFNADSPYARANACLAIGDFQGALVVLSDRQIDPTKVFNIPDAIHLCKVYGKHKFRAAYGSTDLTKYSDTTIVALKVIFKLPIASYQEDGVLGNYKHLGLDTFIYLYARVILYVRFREWRNACQTLEQLEKHSDTSEIKTDLSKFRQWIEAKDDRYSFDFPPNASLYFEIRRAIESRDWQAAEAKLKFLEDQFEAAELNYQEALSEIKREIQELKVNDPLLVPTETALQAAVLNAPNARDLIMDADPYDPEIIAYQIVSALSKGVYGDILVKLMKMSSDHPMILALKASVLLSEGEEEGIIKAKGMVKTALIKAPKDPYIRLLNVAVLFELDEEPNTLLTLLKTYESDQEDPVDPDWLNYLFGCIHYRTRDRDTAEAYFSKLSVDHAFDVELEREIYLGSYRSGVRFSELPQPITDFSEGDEVRQRLLKFRSKGFNKTSRSIERRTNEYAE